MCAVAASTVDIGPYSLPLTVKTLEGGMVSFQLGITVNVLSVYTFNIAPLNYCV